MAHMSKPHSGSDFELMPCKQSQFSSTLPKFVAFGVAFHIKRFAFAI
jgi:hypothetical protein